MRIAILAAAVLLVACSAPEGLTGPHGERGPAGVAGPRGERGADGAPGSVGEDGASVVVDGSRLKARWRVAEDGAREPIGWLDTMTGIPCAWSTATDGEERCLPPPAAGAFGYLDAACTQVVYQLHGDGGSAPTPSAWISLSGRYASLGSLITPSAIYSFGSCAKSDGPFENTYSYEATMFPPSAFVASTQ